MKNFHMKKKEKKFLGSLNTATSTNLTTQLLKKKLFTSTLWAGNKYNGASDETCSKLTDPVSR